MKITSADNANITLLKKLADKKYRRETGLYVIEGERLVADAIRFGAKIKAVYLRESTAEKFATYSDAVIVEDKAFGKISDTVNSQGIVALAEQSKLPLKKPVGNSLVLDGLQDPGNVGTLIRTAAACGFKDVYLCNCADVYSPKVLRAAMSAHFCVRLYDGFDIEKVFGVLDDSTVVCADMHGENLFEQSLSGKTALVLGNEGNGLGKFAKEHCNRTVCLPMEGGFESLNVAIAGSVIMYFAYGGKQK